MKTFRTFRLLFKQNLKKPGFYLVLLLMPLFTFLLSLGSSKGSDTIPIGYYIHDDGESGEIIQEALQNADGLFSFICYDDVSFMQDDVINGKLECAYEFPGDYYEKIMAHERKQLITRYTSASSTMSQVTDETVFSLLFNHAERLAIIDYLTTQSDIATYNDVLYTRDDIEAAYERYSLTETAFSIHYEKEPDSAPLRASDILFSPLKGILAHLVLLAGLAGGLAFYKDPNHYGYRQMKIRLFSVCIPTLSSACMAFLCLVISGKEKRLLFAGLGLLVYTIMVILFTLLLTAIIKNSLLYTAVLPLYLLFSLLLTPVFFDLTLWLPVLRYASYLFIPGYYLRIF
ncbi:MAG: ABC transporter permease [Lachnospiraceae bacterium]|nr:ABC transporter permease [Lachnospiraceae bacterium]